jgi:hypothetical protein
MSFSNTAGTVHGHDRISRSKIVHTLITCRGIGFDRQDIAGEQNLSFQAKKVISIDR